MFDYRARVIDAELSERLTSIGAVLIDGPKGCGKTETALQQAKSSVRFDTDPNARALLDSIRTSCSTKRRRSFSMNGSARRRYGTRYGGMSMICAVVACTS